MGDPTPPSRVLALSSSTTARHPLGLRVAVLERAAILHFDAGVPWEEADARAWDLEVNQGQRSLFGSERAVVGSGP